MDNSQHLRCVIPSSVQKFVAPVPTQRPPIYNPRQKIKVNPTRECLLIPYINDPIHGLHILLSKRKSSSDNPSKVTYDHSSTHSSIDISTERLKPVAVTSFSTKAIGAPLVHEVKSIGNAMFYEFISAIIEPESEKSDEIIASIHEMDVQVGPLVPIPPVITSMTNNTTHTKLSSSQQNGSNRLTTFSSEITSHVVYISWEHIQSITSISPITLNDRFYYQQHKQFTQLDPPHHSSSTIPTLHWVPMNSILCGTYIGCEVDERVISLVAEAIPGFKFSSSLSLSLSNTKQHSSLTHSETLSQVTLENSSEGSSETKTNVLSDENLYPTIEQIKDFPRLITEKEIRIYGAPPQPIPSPTTAALINKIQDDGIIVVDLSSPGNIQPINGSSSMTSAHLPRRRGVGLGTRLRLPKSSSTLSHEFYEQVFD